MRRTVALASGLAMALAAGLAGCADRPSATAPPDPESIAFTHQPGISLAFLRWRRAPEEDVTVTRAMGERGGRLGLRRLGVTLAFSRGALAGETEITLTAYAGDAVAFGFAPHGLVFGEGDLHPGGGVTLTLDLTKTMALEVPSVLDDLVAVYFEGDPRSGMEPKEVLPVRIKGKKLIIEIPHFSGYAIATG